MNDGAVIPTPQARPTALIWPQPFTVEQLETTLRKVIAEPRARTDAILTLEEAIRYTKHESKSAFYRWCSRYHVTGYEPGRFARSQLDRGLRAEAEKKRQPRNAPARKHAAAA